MLSQGLLSLLVVVSMAVPAVADQPVADAGDHEFLTRYVQVGQAVSLDGTASYGRGCDLSYAWTMVSRPEGSSAVLLGGNTSTPEFVPDQDGDYIIDLVVGDAGGTSDPARVTVSAMQCRIGSIPVPCAYPLPAKNAARWMQLTPGLMAKTLPEVALPGTHDSGAYWLNTDARGPDFEDWSYDLGIFGDFSWDSLENDVGYDLTRTQDQALLGQLNGGIRYFDLRVTRRDGFFHTYHGLLGKRLEVLLQDIRTFMEQSEQELVVVNASHMATGTDTGNAQPFATAYHHELMQLVVDHLGPYLYARDGRSMEDLLATPLGQIVGEGPRVLFIYSNGYFQDPAFQADPNANSFWPVSYTSGGGYTNTVRMFDSLPCPRNAAAGDRGQFNDQQCSAKLFLEAGGQGGFTLFQTLTANRAVGENNAVCRVSLGVACDSPRTLRQLTRTVNPYLTAMLEAILPLRPSLILVDHYQESAVVSEAIRLNRGDVVPPRTDAGIVPPPNEHDCNTTSVTVNLVGWDDDGGSGVKEIHHWMSGAAEPDTETTCGSRVDVPIGAKGLTRLHYYGVDRDGNAEEQKTLEVSISPGGDLTGDCKVERDDVRELMRSILNRAVPEAADADDDGVFTTRDFTLMLCATSAASCPL